MKYTVIGTSTLKILNQKDKFGAHYMRARGVIATGI